MNYAEFCNIASDQSVLLANLKLVLFFIIAFYVDILVAGAHIMQTNGGKKLLVFVSMGIFCLHKERFPVSYL